MVSLEPTFDPETGVLTIPNVKWATYRVNGEPATGTRTITEETVVTAEPVPPSHFREGTVTEWTYSPISVAPTVSFTNQDLS